MFRHNMLPISILFVAPFLFVAVNSNASKDKDGITIKKFDLSCNGKIDQVKYYKNGRLIKVETDRNNDDKFDRFTVYSRGVIYKEVKLDTNYDGKVDRIQTYKKVKINQGYKKNKKDKVSITTRIDRNGDGKFEVEYRNSVDRFEERDEAVLHRF